MKWQAKGGEIGKNKGIKELDPFSEGGGSHNPR
jgi:hypothetical protein